ncbi:non-ribosomal peptide synthetase [Leptospira vanthielii]|uniref:Phosphopantetheine attachment domain protein n=1 Tax=Leptospira vanthielii serovar Holland str. Waz Holland = ATCC 700522 TaxID=1218591 RepID=N1W5B1_9LEPT|nr:AMP-binding protein [Leptospira vanthielii]EMY70178.1 phosphopantetheine attachment domain protein [Leptospira vanthielii serovar Holland str. Waz Holland = ATCC 700522]
MASILRFANNDYFLSGSFESDLESQNPILVDPLWKGTKLEKHLTTFPLPSMTSPKSFCLVTSGSTGLPKIVWKEWNEIEQEISYWVSNPEIRSLYTKSEKVHLQVPLCHLYGLLWGFLLPKRLGVPIEYNSSSDNGKLWITSAPKLQSALTQSRPLPESAVVSGMKFPVPLSRVLRDRGGISVLEIYGSTETGGIGYRDPLRQNRFQILPGLETKFRSEEGLEETELQIQSPFLSHQSFLLGEKGWAKETLPPNSYYSTGDLGNWSEFGWYLFGRKDRIIKHNGKRVSLDRIESEILGLSLKGEFVCVPIFDGFGQSIGLFSTGTLPASEILQILRRELPDSHVPRVILTNVTMPTLPNGKPDYPTITKLCNDEYQTIQNQKSDIKTPKPNHSHHVSVLEILESILGIQPEPNKHLVYDYGMESIQYIDLILKLEKKIEHKIPEEDKQTSYFASLSGIEEYIREKLYLLK